MASGLREEIYKDCPKCKGVMMRTPAEWKCGRCGHKEYAEKLFPNAKNPAPVHVTYSKEKKEGDVP